MKYPDYPFTSQQTLINGHMMHYLDEGQQAADAVVMVHGNPSWSFYYRHLVLALRDKHRCIVPDHIGMGLSEKPSDDDYEFTLSRRIDDLEALLDDLGLTENITLIVHDWGGMIGMGYATRHPQRIKCLVILNTGAFHIPEAKTMPWQLTLSRLPVVASLLNQGLNAFCRGAVRQCVTRRTMPKPVADAYLAPYDSWAHRLAVKNFVLDIPLDPEEKSYQTVSDIESNLYHFSNTPMLICWGLKDFVFDQTFLEQWQRHFPDAEVHAYEDAGHYILEDAPEDVIPLVQKFLD